MKSLPTPIKVALPVGLIITIFVYSFNASEFASIWHTVTTFTISTLFVLASYFITFNEN